MSNVLSSCLATNNPQNLCIHHLFEASVELSPDAVAVVFDREQLTYRQLNHRANCLAHHLQALGVEPEVLVGICTKRSIEMVVGMLGILKAGGAYLPLDPAYPSERLAFMLEDAEVAILLTQQHLIEQLPIKEGVSVIGLEQQWHNYLSDSTAQQIQDRENNPPSRVTTDNLAYVIYTSGSTGQPKGVMVQHGSLLNLVQWHQQAFAVCATDRVTQMAGVAFDATGWEIWPYLSAGASIYFPDESTRLDPEQLQQWLISQAITISFLPTPLCEEILRLDWPPQVALRTLLTGGDKLNRYPQSDHPFEVVNNYGPTENTVVTTSGQVPVREKVSDLPAIGRPIDNTQVYILDEQLLPVPLGVTGELYIGGDGLARGYLNRPELTAHKFIPNPLSEQSGSRLYKTGDLARYLPDGNIEYCDRIDNQVKIRGHRIELGEIEATLAQHPGIFQNVVIVQEGASQFCKNSKEWEHLAPLCERSGQDARTTTPLCYGSGQDARTTTPLCYGSGQDARTTTPLCYGSGQDARTTNLQKRDANVQEARLSDKRLVAYVVPDQEQVPTSSQLRHFLEEQLPHYMIPAAFVMLDSLPLTPNGKVDRRALPAPGALQRTQDVDFVAPHTLKEKVIATIWAEVFGFEVGISDNFFEIGGHSLLAVQILSRIRSSLQVELPLSSFYDCPTIASLVKGLEAFCQQEQGLLTKLIQPIPQKQNLPLSFTQEQLWFLSELYPERPIYNETLAIHIKENINPAFLERSLAFLIQRYEILRTSFVVVDEKPLQRIHSSAAFHLSVIDLRDFTEPERETKALELATEDLKKSFNLSQCPLLRATLIQLEDRLYKLFIAVHHLLVDGISIYNIFLPELKALYIAFSQGQSSPLLKPTLQYADFAVWQRQEWQEDVFSTQLLYWKQKLASLPILKLPTDRSRPTKASFQGARQCLALSKSLTDKLKTLSRQESVTLFVTLVAAVKTLLYRYSGQQDIVLGTVTAGRNRSELERVMGNFLNTLVLRTDLANNPSFRELLKRVQQVTLEAYAHQDVPFEKVVAALQPDRHAGENPLFQVAFVLEPPLSEPDMEWTLSQLDVHSGTAKFDLTFELDERPEGIIGRIEYSTDLFDDATISRMIGHFQTMLAGIVVNPNERISELPLLTEAEQHQLLVEWNNTRTEYSQDKCIHQLFEACVEQTPDAVAVIFEDKQLTYRELNARANQLAHDLKSLGVGPEVLVGICVERSVLMVVGLLGILKAGGAYVPLDPDYPTERLSFMLEDAAVSVLLTQQQLVESVPKHQVHVVCLDTDWEEIAQKNESNPINGATPNNLAYVIYTSGSTGKPKGVAVPHRAVNRLVCNTNYIKIDHCDKIAQVSNTSFDAATFEIWGALLHGAQLVGISRDVTLSPHDLALQLRQKSISILFLTTALFQQMARDVPQAFASLRCLLFGGEAVNSRWVKKVLKQEPPKQLLHVYGPTESTTFSASYWVQDIPEEAISIPIGRPITSTQIYLLDKQLQPVPVGVPGELYIGDEGLARGYLNRPNLTAQRFIPNPFSHQPGTRLYRSGDWARYLSDGNIEYLGRIDQQVKIRGFRIELGEIEAVLSQHPNVRETVVIACADVLNNQRLVAYIIPTQEPAVPISSVRRFLKEKLPDYMVPGAFVMLDALPVTPNGKIDRQALPAPVGQLEWSDSFVAPRTPTEQKVANIFAEVLEIEQVGVWDNFFELGGHSLLATQLISRIRLIFAVNLPLHSLFEDPTVAGIAECIETISWTASHLQANKTPVNDREEVEI